MGKNNEEMLKFLEEQNAIMAVLKEDESKIEKLESQLKMAIVTRDNHKKALQCKCEHEYIFVLQKVPLPNFPDECNLYGRCICCDESFEFELWQKEMEKSLVHVCDEVPEDDYPTFDENKEGFITAGRQKLMEILETNPELSQEEIKKVLLEDFISNYHSFKSEQDKRTIKQ